MDSIVIGGDLSVARMGFGAMRLCGPGIMGYPVDRDAALNVLRRALELGVTLVDTADAYGPGVNEDQIAQALHPYAHDLVIATKGGNVRPDGRWVPDGRPTHLRAACEASLRRLKLERIDLYQRHAPDSKVPFDESIGALKDLRDEGKIRHLGLSNVSVAHARARAIVPIASVQNRYNSGSRESDSLVDVCTRDGLALLPYFPIDAGDLARASGTLRDVAERRGATTAQIALAWLLQRSPAVLPIPGTSSLTHLAENVAAAVIHLDEDDLQALAAERKRPRSNAAIFNVVGSAGLEPATPCVSCKCSTPELTALATWGTGGAYTP